MSAAKNIVKGSLKSKLIDLIRLKGPMTVSDYMKIVLTNPESGFYMNKDVFGVKGHFTTNPEISQIFGEILGVWILQEWKRFNCPKPLRLVEFGPGRGTLMSDVTRTLNSFEQSRNNIKISLIEMSPHLREIQRQTLAQMADLSQWHTHIDTLDDDGCDEGFTAYIAHEFLDALPIHKFVRDHQTKNWRELLIDYDKEYNLRFCIARQPSLSTRLLVPKNFDGDHIEVCPQAALHLEKVATRMNRSGKGCMLVCDYGFEDDEKSEIATDETVSKVTSLKLIKSNRDTFRAFKSHASWHPLKDPGEADLTSDVDFGYLKKNLRDKSLLFGSVRQRDFLVNCGLQARLKVLLERAQGEDKKVLISGANMMIDNMGDRYRFLSIFPKGTESLFNGDPPAGFGTSHIN